jgi:hypothetical protein
LTAGGRDPGGAADDVETAIRTQSRGFLDEAEAKALGAGAPGPR